MDQEIKTYWDKTYGEGRHLNRYPYSSVVSFLFRYYPREKKREDVKILEVGFGAGNNLWFAAREGFDVYGIEGSEPAVQYAKERFEEDGLSGDLRHGSYAELPFDNNFFDIVIDRAAVTHASKLEVRNVFTEIQRVMKKQGILLSELYSEQGSFRGDESDNGLLHNLEGPLHDSAPIALYSKGEMRDVFKTNWKMLELKHVSHTDMLNMPFEALCYWEAIVQKTG